MDDQKLREILRNRRIAILGLSPDPTRPSYGVARYMMDQGYEIFGIRPHPTEILGRPCFESLGQVPGDVPVVNVFRASQYIPDVVEECIRWKAAKGIRVLWLQEGIVHPDAQRKAQESGLWVVADRCILKEHLRLSQKSNFAFVDEG